MTIRPVTKEYVIDLQASEEKRWSEVIRHETRAARNLMEAASKVIPGYDPVEKKHGSFMNKAMPLIQAGYRLTGGHYWGEIAAWADAVGVSPAEVTFLNCQYEMSHFSERGATLRQRLPAWLQKLVPFGCTAGAVRIDDGRVIHVRNMDWPLKPIGMATRIFRFVDGDREFVTVGLPGLVGALSGMVPGAYSVTINYAPAAYLPGFAFGPLFLLRQVFETCDTYEEACYALSHTKLSAGVFFMVCSANGKACVIERTRNAFARIPMRGGVLTLANHYRSRKFIRENRVWPADTLAGFKERASTLGAALKQLSPRTTLAKTALVLEEEPVFNEETHQMMVFDPAQGTMLAWSL
jgi:hypothetical protein